MTPDDRMTQVEMILAEQARQIEDLSEMTAAQWAEIDRLKRLVAGLEDQVQDIVAGAAEGSESGAQTVTDIAAANKPPHY